MMDSAAVFCEVWLREVVLCLLDLGDFCEPILIHKIEACYINLRTLKKFTHAQENLPCDAGRQYGTVIGDAGVW